MKRPSKWIWARRNMVAAGCLGLAMHGGFALHAGAQSFPSSTPVTQADRPLALFSPNELLRIEPLLAHSVVALVEFAQDGQLPGILFATEVKAPADVVAAVLRDPAAYPQFVPSLSESTVDTERGQDQSYVWEWRAGIFNFHGTGTLSEYAPPSHRPELGYRFVQRSTAGDLGVGRTVYRLLPRGPCKTILISSSRMDLRDANYLVRQLSAASVSVNRTVNIALAYSMLAHARVEAESRIGLQRPDTRPASADPVAVNFDPTIFESMLERGDVMVMHTETGLDLETIHVLGRLHHSESEVRRALMDPAGFAQSLLQGAHANMLETRPNYTRFEWGIDLPFVGGGGQMEMHQGEDGLARLSGISGALANARFRFRILPRDYGSVFVSSALFDPTDGIWLLNLVANTDVAFRPAISAAAELMMVRGLRGRLARGL